MGIVFLYAALLAVIFVALSVRTLLLRRRLGIAIGDGDDPRMLRAMRAHANFAEYVPFSLLLFSSSKSPERARCRCTRSRQACSPGASRTPSA